MKTFKTVYSSESYDLEIRENHYKRYEYIIDGRISIRAYDTVDIAIFFAMKDKMSKFEKDNGKPFPIF